jgi:hypothetical protein
VPAALVAALGPSKRPPVRATINGYTYRSSVASMGGKFMLGVTQEFRKGAGVVAGDVVDVDLELDTDPRELSVPPDFGAALARNARAKSFLTGCPTATSGAWSYRSKLPKLRRPGSDASIRPSRC